MIIQIVALLMVEVGQVIYAWPITPLEGYSRTDVHHLSLTCGDDLEFPETTFTNLNVTFNNTNNGNNIPAGCYLKLRIALQDVNFEKYGLSVTGHVDIDAPQNDDCESTYLTIADEDTEDDEVGSKMNVCGTDSFTFETNEDILVVEFKIGASGALGNGFQLLIEPHYLCGGVLDLEETIQSPHFPGPYPKDTNCIWDVKAPEDHHISFKCTHFDINPKKKGPNCVEYLKFFGDRMETYCDEPLQSTTFNTNNVVVDFRSGKYTKKFTGFSCKIKFISQNKHLLMSKFFKKYETP